MSGEHMGPADAAVGFDADRRLYLWGSLATVLGAICAGYYVARGPAWPGAALTFASPLYNIGLAAGLLCLLFSFKRPEAGVLLLAALLYTNASEVVVSGHATASPLQLIALATGAGMAARLLPAPSQSRRAIILDPILLPLAAYSAIVFLSSIGASNVQLADTELSEHLKGIVIFVLVTNLVTSSQSLKRIVWAILLSGALLASVSLYQVWTHSYSNEFGGFGHIKVAQIVGQSREPRIAGPLSDPNFYAQILVALAPLALYRLWDERSLLLKLGAGLALAVISFASVLTYSRGGAIALGLVLLLALLQRRIGAQYLVLAALALAPLALFVPQAFEDRIVTLSELVPAHEVATAGEDNSFRQRKRLMTTAWDMFADHPLLGVGAGNYSEHFDEYSGRLGTTLRSYENFGRQRYPHNLYLQVLAETGLAGLTAFVAIIATALMGLWTAYRSCNDAGAGRTANLIASIGLALTAYLTTSLFLHGHYIQYLWLWVALAAAAARIAAPRLGNHRNA